MKNILSKIVPAVNPKPASEVKNKQAKNAAFMNHDVFPFYPGLSVRNLKFDLL